MEYNGLTRKVKFDFEGFRRDFKLDLMELTLNGLAKIGVWDTSTRHLTLNRVYVPPLEETEMEYNIFNRTFKIVIVLVWFKKGNNAQML